MQGRDEIVAVGIETLEEWVDRLNPEFLELAMSNVVEDLNLALWSHLRPQPYPFGPKVSARAVHTSTNLHNSSFLQLSVKARLQILAN